MLSSVWPSSGFAGNYTLEYSSWGALDQRMQRQRILKLRHLSQTAIVTHSWLKAPTSYHLIWPSICCRCIWIHNLGLKVPVDGDTKISILQPWATRVSGQKNKKKIKKIITRALGWQQQLPLRTAKIAAHKWKLVKMRTGANINQYKFVVNRSALRGWGAHVLCNTAKGGIFHATNLSWGSACHNSVYTRIHTTPLTPTHYW